MTTRIFLLACTLVGLLAGTTAHLLSSETSSDSWGKLVAMGSSLPLKIRHQINRATSPGADALVQRSRPHSYASGIARVAPSVVSIYTSETIYRSPATNRYNGDQNSIAPPERRQTNQGSGVLISPDGFVLTSNHLIEDADEIFISLSDGRLFAATKIGADRETDLAVVRTEQAESLPWCNLDHLSTLAIGDIVLAIGNPYGVGQTVTQGIVSALQRQIAGVSSLQNFVQIDAAINPGNSGGALINPDGDLVGINTAVYSRVNGAEGIGFAIPSSLIREVVPQILEHGRVIRGWLGIGVEDRNRRLTQTGNSANGAVIAGLFDSGPASLAGLQRGDMILKVEDEEVLRASQLLTNIARRKPGDSVTLEGIRAGQPFSVTLTLTERPRFETSQRAQ